MSDDTADGSDSESAEDSPSADAPAETEAMQEQLDELEAERDSLRDELAETESELEAVTSRLKRTAADFENYKKRQARKQAQFEAAATDQLLTRMLVVRDNLKRAIDEETSDVDALREGVKLTLAELDKILDAEDVSAIDPDPGAPVDPERHEVMLRVESEEPEDRIDAVYQPGYERDGSVLRPAQVAVSDGPAEDLEDEPVDEQ